MAALLLQHEGQYRVEQQQSAVVVHQPMLLHLGQGIAFGALGLVITGAIHHHIQALLRMQLLGRGFHGRRIGHIQRQGDAARMRRHKFVEQRGLPS